MTQAQPRTPSGQWRPCPGARTAFPSKWWPSWTDIHPTLKERRSGEEPGEELSPLARHGRDGSLATHKMAPRSEGEMTTQETAGERTSYPRGTLTMHSTQRGGRRGSRGI
ncbi:hypothetical protein FKM82_026520 [Ascaphus truei]